MTTKLQSLDDIFLEEEKSRLDEARRQIAIDDADPVIQAQRAERAKRMEELADIVEDENDDEEDDDD